MTTTVTISAGHGWPVKVISINRSTAEATESIVPRNTKSIYSVYDTRDILIHEIQPSEPEFENN